MSLQLSEDYITYVKSVVDRLVSRTGVAVAGTVLNRAGIAERKHLRRLEALGVLKSMPLGTGSHIVNGYYTEGVLPNVLRREQIGYSEPKESPAEG